MNWHRQRRGNQMTEAVWLTGDEPHLLLRTNSGELCVFWRESMNRQVEVLNVVRFVPFGTLRV